MRLISTIDLGGQVSPDPTLWRRGTLEERWIEVVRVENSWRSDFI
jgi:hypothetical protein